MHDCETTDVEPPPLPRDDLAVREGDLGVLVDADGVLVTGGRTAGDSWVASLRGVAVEDVYAADPSVSKVVDLARRPLC